MFHLLKHMFNGQNQFASGGLLLMLLGGVGVSLRSIPEHLWVWFVRQTTMTITVKDEDAAFQWVKEWFQEQEFLKRVRRLDLDTTVRGTEMALMPAPGTHFFRAQGRLFLVVFDRSAEAKGKSMRRMESLTFQTPGRSQAVLRRFVNEIVASHERRERSASLLYIWDDYWTHVQAYSPRLIDSVILKADQKERLVRDVQQFRSSRQRYRQLGVPYHRGYLFYGPPGTGKTSLVSALAAHFGMSIYAFNLTEMTDRSLKNAVNEVPENSVVLFEDIDCMRAGHRRARVTEPGEHSTAKEQVTTTGSGQNVTLSGLLNVLDGFHAPENVIFVMTTNDASALDAALLRPGRIDYRLYMGEAGEAQKVELYRRFFPAATYPEASQFVASRPAETMAAFQGALLVLMEQDASCNAVDSECVPVGSNIG